MKKSKLELLSELIINILKINSDYLTNHPIQGRIRAVGFSIGEVVILGFVGISLFMLALDYCAANLILIIEAFHICN